jgi:hypothetical protein
MRVCSAESSLFQTVAKSASRTVTSRSVISSSPSRFAVGSSGPLIVPEPGDDPVCRHC